MHGNWDQKDGAIHSDADQLSEGQSQRQMINTNADGTSLEWLSSVSEAPACRLPTFDGDSAEGMTVSTGVSPAWGPSIPTVFPKGLDSSPTQPPWSHKPSDLDFTAISSEKFGQSSEDVVDIKPSGDLTISTASSTPPTRPPRSAKGGKERAAGGQPGGGGAGEAVRSRALLTEKQAVEIYAQRRVLISDTNTTVGSRSAKALAREYGVSPKTIRDIWNNRTWTHATGHLGGAGGAAAQPPLPTVKEKEETVRRAPGRPKGAKDKKPRKRKTGASVVSVGAGGTLKHPGAMAPPSAASTNEDDDDDDDDDGAGAGAGGEGSVPDRRQPQQHHRAPLELRDAARGLGRPPPQPPGQAHGFRGGMLEAAQHVHPAAAHGQLALPTAQQLGGAGAKRPMEDMGAETYARSGRPPPQAFGAMGPLRPHGGVAGEYPGSQHGGAGGGGGGGGGRSSASMGLGEGATHLHYGGASGGAETFGGSVRGHHQRPDPAAAAGFAARAAGGGQGGLLGHDVGISAAAVSAGVGGGYLGGGGGSRGAYPGRQEPPYSRDSDRRGYSDYSSAAAAASAQRYPQHGAPPPPRARQALEPDGGAAGYGRPPGQGREADMHQMARGGGWASDGYNYASGGAGGVRDNGRDGPGTYADMGAHGAGFDATGRYGGFGGYGGPAQRPAGAPQGPGVPPHGGGFGQGQRGGVGGGVGPSMGVGDADHGGPGGGPGFGSHHDSRWSDPFRDDWSGW